MTAKTTDKSSPHDTEQEAADMERPDDSGPIADEPEHDAGKGTRAKARQDTETEAGEDIEAEAGKETGETEEKASPVEAARMSRMGRMRRPRPTARTSRRLVAAALALVFATAVATAVIQWRESERLAARDRSEQQVRDRSAEFGRALLAYEHTDLPKARARIRGLASADFGRSYETAFDGLAEVITKYRANATATVRETYLNDFDGEQAKTLVVLDSEVRSTMGVRRVLGTRLLLELVLEKGSWRVDAMTTLPADDETLTKPDGTVERPQQGDAAAPTRQPAP
ncbi:hypothetical protein SAMN04489712_11454 [Thermomonospora echinospora]|uniref:Mce-associated membrane protein n=1 Tax=Thermomonospora echinospora TaxID=1992 RepID=A0A1H6D8H4_9ACTN|nr:hypothetical protein [Thermomonospora echinospora]SEG81428.1 hypothetical protein SAMN04489712_11454 [Thermomonospora echinospora]